jgi:type IV secretion system protein VirB9
MRCALTMACAMFALGSAQAQELASQDGAATAQSSGSQVDRRYRLSGDRALWPVEIGDDGIHTYIVWSEEQSLPAVFAINAIGREEMVDGYMRQGIFTIDRIYEKLVFRIDKKAAKAKRIRN